MWKLVAALAPVLFLPRMPAAQELPAAVLVGGRSTYVVKSGDTIAAIAGRFGVAPGVIIELNALENPRSLAPGQTLVIDNPHIAAVDGSVRMTINIAQRMLFLVDDSRVLAYPVTVGQRTWPTPVGAFTIIDKERDPAWDVPLSIQREMERQGKPVITRMPPSPANPLGAYWVRLSFPSLGIHGTNAPSSIYRFASHGCIRMHPEDVADFFARVSIGDAGRLIYQPVVLAVIDGSVWLEAHPDAYRRAPPAGRYVRDVAEQLGVTAMVDWTAVEQSLRARAGRAQNVTKRD